MTLSLPLSTKFIRTKAEASVAWPHRSISPPGVNQRRWYPPDSGTTNALSERLFSTAIFRIVPSDSHRSMTQTAAGLPSNTLSANASTTYCFIAVPSFYFLAGSPSQMQQAN